MTSPFLSKAEATSFLSVSTSRHNKFLSTSLGMRSDVNSGWEYFYETVADNTANVGESYFKNYKTVRWRPTTNFFLCRARCRTWRQQCFAVVSLQVRRKRFSRNSRSGRSSDSTTSRRRSWASAHTRSSDWREQLACADVGSEMIPPLGHWWRLLRSVPMWGCIRRETTLPEVKDWKTYCKHCFNASWSERTWPKRKLHVERVNSWIDRTWSNSGYKTILECNDFLPMIVNDLFNGVHVVRIELLIFVNDDLAVFVNLED